MKIKQTTFYALKAIRRIYLENEEILTSNIIAEKEKLSQGVLLRLLRILDRAGILCVHQGRGIVSGGFSLAKSIDEITLLDVVKVVEDVDICKNLDEAVGRQDALLFDHCREINNHIQEEFSRYTIRDLFGL